jgi:hypothetical protein
MYLGVVVVRAEIVCHVHHIVIMKVSPDVVLLLHSNLINEKKRKKESLSLRMTKIKTHA